MRSAQGRAGREAREALAKAETELAELRRSTGQPGAPPEEDTTRFREMRAERDALLAEKTEATVTSELRKYVGDFIDQELAVDLLRKNVRLIDGKLVAVGADGHERLNQNLEPLSLKELATELENAKPYLVRSTMRGGVGSTQQAESMLGKADTQQQLHKLFGKGSDARAANALAQKDIRTYRRLRDAAIEKGILKR